MIDSKLRNLEKGLRQDEASPLLDKMVFDKVNNLSKLSYFMSSFALVTNRVSF